jgi:hypothetical protein
MKKVLLIFTIALLLPCFCLTPLLAGEIDVLLQKLVDKKILTVEEANKILDETKEQVKKDMKEIQDKELAVPSALKGLKVEALAYLDYSYGDSPESNNLDSRLNKFSITRGYLTVKKEILPWMSSRFTLDTTLKSDGDWAMRVKYLYAEFRPPDVGLFTGMKSEVGMTHIPWLDFEEYINPYRCQGTMAIERAGVFDSADLGVGIYGDFGGRIENSKEKIGNDHYDGRWGGWHLGIYNGGGYHASETNTDKVVEGRLTLRPLPDFVPGLQFSYFGLYGEGNSTTNGGPDYRVHLGMVSYQHPLVIFTGQYFTTKGNAKGDWVDSRGEALDTEGYSFFGDVKLPVLCKKLSLFARYDHFDQDKDAKIGDDAEYDMYMGGVAYDFYKGNLFLLCYETTDYGRDAGKKGKLPVPDNNLGDDQKVQAVLQIKF